MTPEELLRPRYKVIADYPKSIHKVGTIYTIDGINGDILYCDQDGPRMSHYPHLFRKIEWWEERKPEDMPDYLRKKDGRNKGEICRVKKHKCICGGMRVGFHDELFTLPSGMNPSYDNYLPATEEEYSNQQNPTT